MIYICKTATLNVTSLAYYEKTGGKKLTSVMDLFQSRSFYCSPLLLATIIMCTCIQMGTKITDFKGLVHPKKMIQSSSLFRSDHNISSSRQLMRVALFCKTVIDIF